MVDTTYINNLIKRKDQLISDIEQAESGVRLSSATPRTLITNERLQYENNISEYRKNLRNLESVYLMSRLEIKNKMAELKLNYNSTLLAIKNKFLALKEEDAKIALIKEESKIRLKGLNQEWKVVIGELKELQDKSPIVFREATEIRRAKKDDENKKISK